MALVLTLKKGEDIYIGDERFVLTARDAEGRFVLHHDTMGDLFFEVDVEVEILPGVHIAGSSTIEDSGTRVTIDAPRRIPILLGRRYREAAINAGVG